MTYFVTNIIHTSNTYHIFSGIRAYEKDGNQQIAIGALAIAQLSRLGKELKDTIYPSLNLLVPVTLYSAIAVVSIAAKSLKNYIGSFQQDQTKKKRFFILERLRPRDIKRLFIYFLNIKAVFSY